MSSFNQVVILGNVTRDPQLKALPGGSSVTEFGVAMNRKYKTKDGEDREEVTFVDVAAFGKQGELIQKFFTKGKPIFLVGRLKFDTWEKDGQKRSKLSVVLDNFQFIGAPAGAQGGGGNAGGGKGGQPFGDDDKHFGDADIPF